MAKLVKKITDEQGNTFVYEIEATLDDIKETILNELANNYYLEFTFTTGGQSITVKAKLKRESKAQEGKQSLRGLV